MKKFLALTCAALMTLGRVFAADPVVGVGTVVGDTIVPGSATYPASADVFHLGGWHSVADAAARTNLSTYLRKAGMAVYQWDNGKLYTLDSNLVSWTEFSSGSGTGSVASVTGSGYTTNSGSAANPVITLTPAASNILDNAVTATNNNVFTGSTNTFSNSNVRIIVDPAAIGAKHMNIEMYGTNPPAPASVGPAYGGRRSRGTYGSPTNVESGDILVTLSARGYGDTGWGEYSDGQVKIVATERHTDTNHGTRIEFATTLQGGTSRVTRAYIDDNGITAYRGFRGLTGGYLNNEWITAGDVDAKIASLAGAIHYGTTNAHPVLSGKSSMVMTNPVSTQIASFTVVSGTNDLGSFACVNAISNGLAKGSYDGLCFAQKTGNPGATLFYQLEAVSPTYTNLLTLSSFTSPMEKNVLKRFDFFAELTTNYTTSATNEYLTVHMFCVSAGSGGVDIYMGDGYPAYLMTPSVDFMSSDTPTLNQVLTKGNSAGTNNINLNGNSATNVGSVKFGIGGGSITDQTQGLSLRDGSDVVGLTISDGIRRGESTNGGFVLTWHDVPRTTNNATSGTQILNYQTATGLLALATAPYATNFVTWSGTNTDASNTNNWTPKRLPTSSDTVYVDGMLAVSYNPSGTIRCRNFVWNGGNYSSMPIATIYGDVYIYSTVSSATWGGPNIYGNLTVEATDPLFSVYTCSVFGNLNFLNRGYLVNTAYIYGDVWLHDNGINTELLAHSNGFSNVYGDIRVAWSGATYYGLTSSLIQKSSGPNKMLYTPTTATSSNEVVNYATMSGYVGSTFTSSSNYIMWAGSSFSTSDTNNWTPKRIPTRYDHVYIPSSASYTPTGMISAEYLFSDRALNAGTLVINCPMNVFSNSSVHGANLTVNGDSEFQYPFSSAVVGGTYNGNVTMKNGCYNSAGTINGDAYFDGPSWTNQYTSAGGSSVYFKGKLRRADVSDSYVAGFPITGQARFPGENFVVFSGRLSGDVSVAANWTPQRVPMKADIAFFPYNAFTPSGTITCNKLIFDANNSSPSLTSLTVNGDTYIYNLNTSISGGTFNGNLSVDFNSSYSVGNITVLGNLEFISTYGYISSSSTIYGDVLYGDNGFSSQSAGSQLNGVRGSLIKKSTGVAYSPPALDPANDFVFWTGIASTDPSNVTNWAPRRLPTKADNVSVIYHSTGLTTMPAGTITCNKLTWDTAGQLGGVPSSPVTVNGDTLLLNYNASGTLAGTYNGKLSIDVPSAGYVGMTALTVNGDLEFTSSAGYIGGSSANVYGNLILGESGWASQSGAGSIYLTCVRGSVIRKATRQEYYGNTNNLVASFDPTNQMYYTPKTATGGYEVVNYPTMAGYVSNSLSGFTASNLITWVGNISPSASDTNNWLPKRIPTRYDSIYIPSSAVNSPSGTTDARYMYCEKQLMSSWTINCPLNVFSNSSAHVSIIVNGDSEYVYASSMGVVGGTHNGKVTMRNGCYNSSGVINGDAYFDGPSWTNQIQSVGAQLTYFRGLLRRTDINYTLVPGFSSYGQLRYPGDSFVVWSSTASTDPSVAANWTPQRVPIKTDTVYVPYNSTTISGIITCNKLFWDCNVSVPPSTITVYGDTYVYNYSGTSLAGTYYGNLTLDFGNGAYLMSSLMVYGNLDFINYGYINSSSVNVYGNVLYSENAWASQTNSLSNLTNVKGYIIRKSTQDMYYGNTNVLALAMGSASSTMNAINGNFTNGTVSTTATNGTQIVNYQTATGLVAGASGALITWTGVTSTDVGTASNWSPARVPTRYDNVYLATGPVNSPINTLTAGYVYVDRQLGGGSVLTINAPLTVINYAGTQGANLVINGDTEYIYSGGLSVAGGTMNGKVTFKNGCYLMSGTVNGDAYFDSSSWANQNTSGGASPTYFKGRIRRLDIANEYTPGWFSGGLSGKFIADNFVSFVSSGSSADAGNITNWVPRRLPTRADVAYFAYSSGTTIPTGTINCATFVIDANYANVMPTITSNLTVNGNTLIFDTTSSSWSGLGGTYNGNVSIDAAANSSFFLLPGSSWPCTINGNLEFLSTWGYLGGTNGFTLNGNLILGDNGFSSQQGAGGSYLTQVKGDVIKRSTGVRYYGNTNVLTQISYDPVNRVYYSQKTAASANEVVNYQTWTNNLNFMLWTGAISQDPANTNNWSPKRLPTKYDNVAVTTASVPTGTITCASILYAGGVPSSGTITINGDVYLTYDSSPWSGTTTTINGNLWMSGANSYPFGGYAGSSGSITINGRAKALGGKYFSTNVFVYGDTEFDTSGLSFQLSNIGTTNFYGSIRVAGSDSSYSGYTYWPKMAKGSVASSAGPMIDYQGRNMYASNFYMSANATGGTQVVNWPTLTNRIGSVISGTGIFLMTENGTTSILYHVTSGNHTNKIGEFYTN